MQLHVIPNPNAHHPLVRCRTVAHSGLNLQISVLSRQIQLLLKNDETNIPSIFQFNRHQNNTMTSSSPDTGTSFETRLYYCRAVWQGQSCQIVVPHLTWFGDFNGFKRRAIAILTLSLTIATVWGLEQTQTTITYFTLILKSLESS